MGSVFMEEAVERSGEVISDEGYWSESDSGAGWIHSGGGFMLMQIGHGSWAVWHR